MPKHLYLVFLSTLLIGFCVGVFVFLSSREVNTEESPVKNIDSGTFEIHAYMYGGCQRMSCPSYRLQQNGMYSYIAVRTSVGTDQEHFDDCVSEKQLDELVTLLKKTDFKELKKTAFVGTCPIQHDGVAYRFEVQISGESYSIDSCVENIEGLKLFSVLEHYFELFDVAHQVST